MDVTGLDVAVGAEADIRTGVQAASTQLLLAQARTLRAELKNLRSQKRKSADAGGTQQSRQYLWKKVRSMFRAKTLQQDWRKKAEEQEVNKAVQVHKKSIEDLRALLYSLKRGSIQADVPIQNDVPTRNQLSLSLEKGNIQTTPIGYIDSCFFAKNGTPRQPTVCGLSRARLKISKTIFTNAEHSLMGLEQFSHVWIIFIFHKNGHQSYKAKVKPPRLNGLKTGVFSTRSPHRPNAVGLTLGKLDKIEGDTLYLSGIDMIQGTPVLDIKPYIPDYDAPRVDPMDNVNESQGVFVPEEQCQGIPNPISGKVTEESEDKQSIHVKVASKVVADCAIGEVEHSPKDTSCPFRKTDGEIMDEKGKVGKISLQTTNDNPEKEKYCEHQLSEKVDQLAGKGIASYESIHLTVEKIKSQLVHSDIVNNITEEEEVICFKPEKSLTVSKRKKTDNVAINIPWNKLPNGNIATWIKQPPVISLKVRFTPHAEMDLQQFQAPGGSDPEKMTLNYFQSVEEIKSAMMSVLSADPRSIYRRTQCQDMLFYFTLDTAHITTWFGDGFSEILRIKPLKEPPDIGTVKV